jgi:transposase InsO family protein
MTTKKPLALREWRYPRTYRTIYAKEPGGIFQADVMELYPLWSRIFAEKEREKYRPKDYAFVCIDVYSRYVWSEAIDKQDYPSISAAILKTFFHMGKPKNLQGDQKIIDVFRNQLSPLIKGVTLVPSKPHETNKNAIVERAIRTLKNDLLKYLYDHPFPRISGRFISEEYREVDTTTQILQEICILRNHTVHRTIHQRPFDVFYRRAVNRQIIVKKKYPEYEQRDLVIVKPLRERGELDIKIFGFDYDIYVILLKEGDKYKLQSLYNFIHEINKIKKRWYKPYELRKITPRQALEHLESPLARQYLYHQYEENTNVIEDMKNYLRSLL